MGAEGRPAPRRPPGPGDRGSASRARGSQAGPAGCAGQSGVQLTIAGLDPRPADGIIARRAARTGRPPGTTDQVMGPARGPASSPGVRGGVRMRRLRPWAVGALILLAWP